MTIIKTAEKVLDIPETAPLDLLNGENTLQTDIKKVVKSLYDGIITEDNLKDRYEELLTDEAFTTEQIWQQLDVVNSELNSFVNSLARASASKKRLKVPVETCLPEILANGDREDDDEEEEDGGASEEEKKQLEMKPAKTGKKVTIVTDKPESSSEESEEHEEGDEEGEVKQDRFFSLKDMEKFMDKEETGMEDDDIDMFQDIPSEEEDEGQAKYDDFFGDPDDEREDNRVEDGDDDLEDEEGDVEQDDEELYDSDDSSASDKNVKKSVSFKSDMEPENQSTFEKRTKNLENRIRKLEEAAVGEKPWVLKGEVDAKSRPMNSLLEEVLEFDLTQRPAPVITEEVTMKLEDIILKRIKDEAWDDVERKVKPVNLPHELKKKVTLDQEKSKLSLAEIYEKEFLKEKSKQDGEVPEEEISEEKKKITKMMNILFAQLDTLSNYHYTPKMGNADIKIVSNMPAITVEEVAPVTSTDANMLAPGEIAGKFKHQPVAKEEKSTTDKKRERRKKKALQSKKAKWRIEKGIEQKTKFKINKSNILTKDNSNSLKSSSSFFNKLQDEVVNQIAKKKRPAPLPENKANPKKLKL